MIPAERAAAIVLAAGQSKRFGPGNKLLHLLDGTALVRHTVATVVEAGIQNVIVVTGDDAESVKTALTDLPITFVHNATPWAGMGTSLAAGANAVDADMQAVFIVLGDMPMLQTSTIKKLLKAADNDDGHDIAVPVHDGRRGHPVLFGKRYLTKLRALNTDQGARAILHANPERIRAVSVDDPGTVTDIDTQDDLVRICREGN